MASCLHFLALLITKSGFSSECHTEHALRNNFFIKYLLATHMSWQTTTRNKTNTFQAILTELLRSLSCQTRAVLISCSVVSGSLWPHGLYSPWNSPGQNTRVGSHSLLQGIFQTQGSNPGLLHCPRILYQLSHKGSPRNLEWVAYPFSSGSSWPKNRTRVSCIACGFFTNWAMREAW